MISDFLAPVENEILKFKKTLPQASVGKKISCYGVDVCDLSKTDIALLGLNESRGSDDFNKKYLKTNNLRKELYSLFCGDWSVNLIDLGDVINGDKLSDSYYAIQIISEILLKK